MKYFVILLVLVGFVGSASAQYVGDSEESGLIWPPVCIGGPGMCPPYDQWIKGFFNNAISEPFDQSDNVIVGTIIQAEILDSQSITYSIAVDFYLKNTQSFDSLSATLDNPTEMKTFPEVLWYNSPVFEKGDLVFVYLKKTDGTYKVLPQSFAIDKHEIRGPPPSIIFPTGPNQRNFDQGQEVVISGTVRKAELYNVAIKGETLDVKITIQKNDKVTSHGLATLDSDGNYIYKFQTAQMPPGIYDIEINFGPQTTGDRITIDPNLKFWTPLKQFKSGIPIDELQCRENLILIQKYDGLPACVKPNTKQKLTDRGWTGINKISKESLVNRYSDVPEVVAFYETYEDVEVLVQDDHVSYFAGSDDDYFVRMNLIFDGNYAIKDIDLHCYFQRTHQYELPQEDIVSEIAKYDCKEYGKTVRPEPESLLESETLQKQQQAKLYTQEIIMTDHRGHQHQIDTINEYRKEFESGYFLEHFILSNKQNYEKDNLINFIFVEWGYQPQECTYPKVKVYLRPYDNYDKIEKISEWQKPNDECLSLDSDSGGYLIMNSWPMPGISEPYQTCTIPGEYRVVASNLQDESKKEFGYYTCQKEKLVGEPQPWMELPE